MKTLKTMKVSRVWTLSELIATDPYPYGDPLPVFLTSVDYKTKRIILDPPVYTGGAWKDPVIIIPVMYKNQDDYDIVIFKSRNTLCETFNVKFDTIKSIMKGRFLFKGTYSIHYLQDILPNWRECEMKETTLVKLYL